MHRCCYLLIVLLMFLGAANAQDAAQETTPKSALGYNARGLARHKSGDYDGAMADFNKSLDLDPGFWPTYMARGLTLSAKRDYEGAIAAFTKVISLNPESSAPFKERGQARHELGDHAGAIADLDKAIEIDSGYSEAYAQRGRARLSVGDHEGAQEDFEKVIGLEPDVEAYTGRGLARAGLRDFDGANADFAQAIAYKTNNPAPYLGRGSVRLEQDDLDGAMADFDKALALEPKSADAHNGRGMVRSNKGDISGAVSEFSKAIELNPKLAAAYYNRGWNQLYLAQGELAHADASTFLRITSNLKNDSSRLYMVIVGYFGLRQAQKINEAKAFIATLSGNLDASSWAASVIKYLRGEIVAKELLDLGTAKGKKTELRARLYLGLDASLAGSRELALEHLRIVRASGDKTSREYILADSELKRIERSPRATKKTP